MRNGSGYKDPVIGKVIKETSNYRPRKKNKLRQASQQPEETEEKTIYYCATPVYVSPYYKNRQV